MHPFLRWFAALAFALALGWTLTGCGGGGVEVKVPDISDSPPTPPPGGGDDDDDPDPPPGEPRFRGTFITSYSDDFTAVAASSPSDYAGRIILNQTGSEITGVEFLPAYIDQRIFEASPFAVLDEEGVGELVRMGVEKGREARPDIEIGICGEHGGDPKSVDFCHRVGLDYVSCSPLRVPIARLAAAQAQVNNPR